MPTERRLPVCAILAAMLAACQPPPFLPEVEQIDVLIEDGLIVDGRGGEPFVADVVIAGDRIVFVGDAPAEPAGKNAGLRIGAGGRVVAPGFIDLHSHGEPLETPAFENFLAMGVTTITLGQDGSSPDADPLSDWLAAVAERGIGPNLAMFVGHGTLRNLSGIGNTKTPAPEQLERMLGMLRETLAYTFGMSTGLEYNPGLNAGTEELVALAAVAGERDRLVMSHLRNEDDEQLESSIAELLEQGHRSRVHISHLKSVYGKGEQRADEILGVLDRARDAGIRVTADMYPYAASYTDIGILFPEWSKTPEQFAAAKAERREALADYLRRRVTRRNGPEATLLGTEPWTGKTLAELSFELEMPFEDVLIDVIGPGGASGAYFVMDEALQSRLLLDEHVGVASDGSPTGFHPRGHGTFARLIEKYVVGDELLSLAEAVRKVTSFPAALLGLHDRGVVAAGMFADLVIFDPERVRENATYPAPLQPAEGFDLVIVNGRVARADGNLAEGLHGRVLAPEVDKQ